MAELRRRLAPVYLVTGDDPLLVMEACDAVLVHAKNAGFTERTLLEPDDGEAFAALHDAAASLSLFADRRIIEIRAEPAAFDKTASEALREYLQRPPPDVLLLLRTGRLDNRQRDAAWVGAVDSAGVVVTLWPVTARELPRWLMERARGRGAELTREAADYLAWRVEGNLLAAAQEIEKLVLLPDTRPLRLETVSSSVTDSSFYGPFDAIDAALAGEAKRLRHMLYVLELEGVQPLVVLGALASQLRRLISGVQFGRLPPDRERALREAEKRLTRIDLERFLVEASQIDQQCKGMLEGDTWRSLGCLLLAVAGAPTTRFLTDDAPRLRRLL